MKYLSRRSVYTSARIAHAWQHKENASPAAVSEPRGDWGWRHLCRCHCPATTQSQAI